MAFKTVIRDLRMTKEIATASAREVASYLKKEHGATRVLLFGSAAKGEFLPRHSNIDLARHGYGVDLKENKILEKAARAEHF